MAMNLPALAIQAFPGPKILPPLLMQKTTSSPHPGYYLFSSSWILHPLLIKNNTSSPRPGYYLLSSSRIVHPILIQDGTSSPHPVPGSYLLSLSRMLPPLLNQDFGLPLIQNTTSFLIQDVCLMSSSRILPPNPIQNVDLMSSSRVLPPVLIHPGHYYCSHPGCWPYPLIQYIGLLSSSIRFASCPHSDILFQVATSCSYPGCWPNVFHPVYTFLFSSRSLASCSYSGHYLLLSSRMLALRLHPG